MRPELLELAREKYVSSPFDMANVLAIIGRLDALGRIDAVDQVFSHPHPWAVVKALEATAREHLVDRIETLQRKWFDPHGIELGDVEIRCQHDIAL